MNNGQRDAYAMQDTRDTPKRIDAHLRDKGTLNRGNTAEVRDAALKLVCDERVPGADTRPHLAMCFTNRRVNNPVAAHHQRG